jgi:chromosomal replication initiation ATPase DnaA
MSLVASPETMLVAERIIADAEIQLTQLVGHSIKLRASVGVVHFNHSGVQNAISEYFDVSWFDIIGRKRYRHIVEARHAYCYIMRTFTSATVVSIGKSINRDHTSVLHARDTVQDLLDCKNETMVKAINHLMKTLGLAHETETKQ